MLPPYYLLFNVDIYNRELWYLTYGMNHFITSRAYTYCSRTYVWCSTENTVSLFPLSKTYKSISVALINKLASPDSVDLCVSEMSSFFFYFSQSLSRHLLYRPAQHTLIIICLICIEGCRWRAPLIFI
jgi:hypothetical protein